MKPLVSVFMAARRPYNWLRLYRRISTSSVPFEMIFVGPVKPEFALPENMKYIHTDVKPSQCTYIAAKATTGKYIMFYADDMAFSNAFLDHMVNEAENCSNIDNTIITPNLTEHGQNFFGDKDKSTPLLPVGLFMTKKLWDRYGIDKNFYGVYWDLDIAMMNYADGGTIIKCNKVTTSYFRAPKGTPRNLRKASRVNLYQAPDKSYFYSLWLKDFQEHDLSRSVKTSGAIFSPTGNFTRRLKRSPPPRGSWIREQRARPLDDPIVDSDDILTVSQGVQTCKG